MQITTCTKDDFDQILSNLNSFWGNLSSARLNKIKHLHHPILIYELGDNAFVIKEDGQVLSYLFGLFSQTEPLAYVQFVATHRDYRRQGLAKRLYEHFIAKAKENGYRYVKAITTSSNKESISFHKNLGMDLLGEPNEDGIPVVKDYAGPGQDRVVFFRGIVS